MTRTCMPKQYIRILYHLCSPYFYIYVHKHITHAYTFISTGFCIHAVSPFIISFINYSLAFSAVLSRDRIASFFSFFFPILYHLQGLHNKELMAGSHLRVSFTKSVIWERILLFLPFPTGFLVFVLATNFHYDRW